MFSPHGHGMSCFYCNNCDCKFGVDCLHVIEEMFCPRCGSEDIERTEERLVGKYHREYESVEQYEEEQDQLHKKSK